jgi:hypothetical protein
MPPKHVHFFMIFEQVSIMCSVFDPKPLICSDLKNTPVQKFSSAESVDSFAEIPNMVTGSVSNYFFFVYNLKPIHTARNGYLLTSDPGRIIGS